MAFQILKSNHESKASAATNSCKEKINATAFILGFLAGLGRGF